MLEEGITEEGDSVPEHPTESTEQPASNTPKDKEAEKAEVEEEEGEGYEAGRHHYEHKSCPCH